MVKRPTRGTEFLLLETLADLAAVAFGLWAGYWIRFHSGLIPLSGGWEPLLYARQFPWAVGLWWLSLNLTHNYRNHPRVISFNRARRLFKGSGLAIALIIARNYFWREPDVARLLYPLALLCVTTALVAGRLALQQVIVRYFVGNSLKRTPMLIVGTGPTALRLAARIRLHPEYGYDLRGFVATSPGHSGRRIGGFPVLGIIADLRNLLREHAIDDIFVAQSEIPNEAFARLCVDSEMEIVRVHVIPTLADMMRSTIFYDEVAGVPVYRLRETPLQGWNIVIKRVFDLAVAGGGLLLLSPLLVIVGWLVRRTSRGPALYAQERLGLDGRKFTLYKFRSMHLDAERDGPGWGGQEDPRATRLGAFLRRWNMDELPQLWNVLRGDMSLVGPRPERPVYVDEFRERFPRYMTRHKVLSGLTGWAQVHGLRGDTSISQRLRYDLYYIENWSLWLDIKILLMTFLRPWGVRTRRPLADGTLPSAARIHLRGSDPSCQPAPPPAPSTPTRRAPAARTSSSRSTPPVLPARSPRCRGRARCRS
ncbi:exopolysaccharide biosynthesis polyprenyl glycosylphosphotransferase, partial [Candidatus Poribacteria bacterium]|nr:exopolysaccharide biosynthesis polyprenyl glycosylphosphotransferase [Candidatus Poribacteria bacterium]